MDRFFQRRVGTLRPVLGAIFPVVVHVVSAPDTEANAREQGVAVYLSYQFHQGTEQKV